jgi:D-alanyl-lipoteichoic acid acyltransferase DltB (MBOAT superfamily)
MTLTHIAIFGGLTLLAALFFQDRSRGLFMFTLSILAVYALQPALPIRYLDFWLPTAALGLAVIFWFSLTPPASRFTRENIRSAAWMAGIILLLALTRFLASPILTASAPPRLEWVLAAILLVVLLAVALGRLHFAWTHWFGLVALIALLVILKSPGLSLWLARLLRLASGQSLETASSFDIRWLGISYIIFRILHTLRDRQLGEIPVVSLREYVTFIFFYPALTAGPIDRLERFIGDLRTPNKPGQEDWMFIVRRLGWGLFKKFVIADSLALMALNAQNAGQVNSTGWAWLMMYAYTLQIYFDFSGYTDIAIGLGRMLGVRLPENFNRPYLRSNLAQFWNNWHISLTQWFRSYFFYPFALFLRSKKMPAWSMILLTQLATMVLIGLWHGVTWNFVAWGLWHGFGLFIHNRWHDMSRARNAGKDAMPFRHHLSNGLGVILTFNFVALGWVWFVLPTPALAVHFIARLFGV